MCLSPLPHREVQDLDSRGLPKRITRFEEDLSVIVRLTSVANHVKLQLVKDHGNPDVAAVRIELGPRRLGWADGWIVLGESCSLRF